MTRDGYFRPNLHDFAARINQKSRTLDSHTLFSIHILLDYHPECITHGRIRIRQEGKRQVVLGLELRLSGHAVATDADNLDALLRECLVGVAELRRFVRSTRRVRAWIKPDDERLACVRRKHHPIPLVIAGAGLGNLRSDR